jgi:hypothetical protein
MIERAARVRSDSLCLRTRSKILAQTEQHWTAQHRHIDCAYKVEVGRPSWIDVGDADRSHWCCVTAQDRRRLTQTKTATDVCGCEIDVLLTLIDVAQTFVFFKHPYHRLYASLMVPKDVLTNPHRCPWKIGSQGQHFSTVRPLTQNSTDADWHCMRQTSVLRHNLLAHLRRV